MNSFKFLSIFYLIINTYSYDYTCHSYNHLDQQQLEYTIQNTPNPSQKNLNFWLKIAFEQKWEDIIRYILLNTRFNLNYQDELGNTWLHYAAVLCNPEFVKILLQKDIGRNTRNIFGDTALHHNAKYNPNLQIIKLLFMTGVNPDIRNNDGQTALDAYFSNNSNLNNKIIIMLKKHPMRYFLP
jgi:ankyrin repeat protein